MSGFGEWLRDTPYRLTEITSLRAVAATIGVGQWPIASTQQNDYEATIRARLPAAEQPAAILALQSIWPVYEQADQHTHVETSLVGRAFSNLPGTAVIVAGLFIIYIYFSGHSPD